MVCALVEMGVSRVAAHFYHRGVEPAARSQAREGMFRAARQKRDVQGCLGVGTLVAFGLCRLGGGLRRGVGLLGAGPQETTWLHQTCEAQDADDAM